MKGDVEFEVFAGAAAFEEKLRRFVEVRCTDGVSRRAARDFIDSLDDSGLALFVCWLESQQERILYEEIRRIQPVTPTADPAAAKTTRSDGSPRDSVFPVATKKSSPAAAFGAAVEGFTRGDVDALSDFRLVYHIRGLDKRLGEMTGNDHLEVAGTFQSIGASSLLLAAIHRRIGRALGGRRTQDVFSEADYRGLFAHSFRDSDDAGCVEALKLESPLKALPAQAS